MGTTRRTYVRRSTGGAMAGGAGLALAACGVGTGSSGAGNGSAGAAALPAEVTWMGWSMD